jgi:hypothetical protein
VVLAGWSGGACPSAASKKKQATIAATPAPMIFFVSILTPPWLRFAALSINFRLQIKIAKQYTRSLGFFGYVDRYRPGSPRQP